MGYDARAAVADLLDEIHGQNVNRKLNDEHDEHELSYLRPCYREFLLKYEVEKRCEVYRDRLRYIAYITRASR